MKTLKCDNQYRKIMQLPVIILVLLFSCQQDEPVLLSDKSITSFSILAIDNQSLSADVNGTLTPADGKAHGKAVFVSGGVVYVAGQYWDGSVWIMQVWKNDTPETISTAGSVEVFGMFVSGGNFYIVDTEKRDDGRSTAKIWKNGSGTFLSEINGSQPKSVYVYNDDVYVAGLENDNDGKQVATLWKNGMGTPLATDAFATGVMVK